VSAGPLGDLLTPGEVAELLRVDAKTVTRWARAGLLDSIRTPGGHRRYWAMHVQAMRGLVTEGEIRLRSQDITVICEALSKGSDPGQAKELIGKVLSEASVGSVIRVTG
jgi:excisionase family DNA binding protein